MKRFMALGALLGLGCGGDARTTLHPPAPDAGAGGAGSIAGASGAGGALPLPLPVDAGADAADASGGSGGLAGLAGMNGFDGSVPDPGGPIPIVIDPESIVVFELPIDSLRVAAAGVDAATGICASIIWDYSNNGLELERHCDDFGTYPSFPYVLLREPPASCEDLQSFWNDPVAELSTASGCIDPLARTVNVEIESFSPSTFYRIIMNNEP